MTTTILAVGAFILFLAVLVTLRTKIGNKFEIKNTDIIIALIPVVLALFLTGKVQELTIGDIKVALLLKEASRSQVSEELTALPVDSVRLGTRESLIEIPDYIKNKIEALSFQMSKYTRGGSNLIVSYLEALTKYPFLRYIIINNPEGSFFGMADAQQIAALSRASESPFDYNSIANWLLEADKEHLRTLPGFIGYQDAIQGTTDKLTAIQKMDSLDVPILPVLDDGLRFRGIVEKSRLTSSILVDIIHGLDKK